MGSFHFLVILVKLGRDEIHFFGDFPILFPHKKRID